jgi:hypothetical protein
VARPMPLLPPVMRALLPVSLMIVPRRAVGADGSAWDAKAEPL